MSTRRPAEDRGVARLLELLLPEAPPSSWAAVGARATLLLIAALWASSTVAAGFGAAAESMLHLVHLPLHEAGHVLCLPFGRFFMTLGGSLMQVLVPLACLGVLLFKTRDALGAALALMWTGHSLMDLAPYIADARALELVLLGGYTGAEVEGHDWEYILGTLGLLEWDRSLGRLAHAGGTVLLVGALLWASAAVWRQVQSLRSSS